MGEQEWIISQNRSVGYERDRSKTVCPPKPRAEKSAISGLSNKNGNNSMWDNLAKNAGKFFQGLGSAVIGLVEHSIGNAIAVLGTFGFAFFIQNKE